jgi:outer membrane protein assembly factor BamB
VYSLLMPNFGQYSLSLFMEDKDMYSGESQQFLCLASYQPPCLSLRALHSTTGEQLWYEELPIQLNGGVGALVVSNGMLYLTDYNGDVVAIDATTRRICWHCQGQLGQIMRLDVLDDIVLPHNYKHILPALHAPTGQVLWTKREQDNTHDFLCPVRARNAIFMTAHEEDPSTPFPGRVYALDPQTGSGLWQKHFPSELVYVRAATDEMVYAAYPPGASLPGMLHALDARDGSTIWTMPLVSGVYCPASVINNVLYLVVIPYLLALDPRTGELLWSYEHESIQDHPLYQSITLLENQDHLLTCQRACELEHNAFDYSAYRLSAIDRTTGKLLRVVKSGYICEGRIPTFFTSSSQQVVYLHLYSQPWKKRPNFFAISKQDGSELWSTHLSYKDFPACS